MSESPTLIFPRSLVYRTTCTSAVCLTLVPTQFVEKTTGQHVLCKTEMVNRKTFRYMTHEHVKRAQVVKHVVLWVSPDPSIDHEKSK